MTGTRRRLVPARATRVLTLAALLGALATAGCGSSGGLDTHGAATSPPSSPGSSQTPAAYPATAHRVTLVKSGGEAGVHDKVVVEPDGRWTFTTRDSPRQAGRLTQGQNTKLRTLAGSRALANEARHPQLNGAQCADAFTYQLTVDDLAITREQCGATPPSPTFYAIVTLLSDATPLT